MGYREASIMMTKAQEPMTDLDALLMKAREADPGDRIDLRDEIAAHGEAAIEAMNDWLADPRLAAFAIRVLERVGQSPAHRPAVLEVLAAIDRDELPPHLESDLNRALGSLGVAVPLPTAGGRGRRQSPARRPIGTRDHDHRAPSALEGRARARVDEPEDRVASIRRGQAGVDTLVARPEQPLGTVLGYRPRPRRWSPTSGDRRRSHRATAAPGSAVDLAQGRPLSVILPARRQEIFVSERISPE